MDLSVSGLGEAYKNGSLTPRDVLAEIDARIEATASHNAWIHILSPAERQPFLERLEGTAPGSLPLWGVPFAIKDNIDLAGCPTTAGCPAFAYTPEKSATTVARLLEAGAIPIGKTNLDQFATGLVGTRSPYGPMRNALDPAYLAGGSSGGSAVAVKLGLCSFALGTDTAGSGRVPAAFHALVGLKPTRGWWSNAGLVPACKTLDCISVFTHTVHDARVVATVVGGFDDADTFSRRLPAVTLNAVTPVTGVVADEHLGACTEETRVAYRRFVSTLSNTVEIDPTPFFDAARLLYEGPWLAERYAALEPFLTANPDALFPVTRQIIGGGAAPTAVDAFNADYRLAELRRKSDAAFDSIDVLALPTAPGIFTIEEEALEPVALNSRLGTYTNFVNLLDLCALAIPSGPLFGPFEMGITLISPAGTDFGLLDVGAKLLGEPPLSQPGPRPGECHVAVCGAHLAGQPLNKDLLSRGGYLVRACQSAEKYRFFALPDGRRPAMVRVANGGVSIEVEVWAIPDTQVGGFLATIAPPLGLGTVELEDGSLVNGFIAEAIAQEGSVDISEFGGWRAYKQQV